MLASIWSAFILTLQWLSGVVTVFYDLFLNQSIVGSLIKLIEYCVLVINESLFLHSHARWVILLIAADSIFNLFEMIPVPRLKRIISQVRHRSHHPRAPLVILLVFLHLLLTWSTNTTYSNEVSGIDLIVLLRIAIILLAHGHVTHGHLTRRAEGNIVDGVEHGAFGYLIQLNITGNVSIIKLVWYSSQTCLLFYSLNFLHNIGVFVRWRSHWDSGEVGLPLVLDIGFLYWFLLGLKWLACVSLAVLVDEGYELLLLLDRKLRELIEVWFLDALSDAWLGFLILTWGWIVCSGALVFSAITRLHLTSTISSSGATGTASDFRQLWMECWA